MAKDVMAKIQDLLIRAGVTEENAKAITEKCDKEEVELKLDTEKAKEEKKAEEEKAEEEKAEEEKAEDGKEEKEEKVEEAEGETCEPEKEPEDDAEQEEAPVDKELAKGVKVEEAEDKDETEEDEVEVEKDEEEKEEEKEEDEVDESFDLQAALTCLVEMLKEAKNEFESLKEELAVKTNDLEVVKEAYAKLIAEKIIAEQEADGVEDDTDETVVEEKEEDTVDKRDLLREIMAIAGEHEDNEDVKTIAKKAEKLAYAKDEDKRDIIREIMAIAGKHEDNEDVRTIAKKAEKLAYDKDERANESEETQDETADKISEDVENITEEVAEAPKKRRVYSAFGSINESEEISEKTRKV